MTGRADKRRPLLIAMALIAAIGAALVAPVMIGARKGEPIPGTTVRADSRESIAVATPVALFQSPAVVLERGTVALVSSATGESRVGALLRALTGGESIDLVLDGARLVVHRAGGAGPAAATADGPPVDLRPVVASLSAFRFRSLTVLDTIVAVETGRGAPETVSLRNVEIAPGRNGLVTARGQIAYRGERFDIDLAFTGPEAATADAPLQIRAVAKGDNLSLSFNGRLAAGEHAQLTADNAELSVTDLRGFADWLGVSWPRGPGLGLFTARGRLTLDERSAAFEHAEVTLDGNAATGTLMVKLGTERPAVEGTLAFSQLNIAPYAAPSRPYALALASDWISSLRIPGLVSPSFLRGMDADIRLSAATVTSGSDRLGRAAASVSVRDGKLYGEIAELEFEQGGRGEGQVTVDVAGADPRYTIRAELNDIDMATVMAPRLGPAAIDGRGDVSLDLAATGSSEAELLASLTGKLALGMDEGVRIGLDIDALAAPGVPATAATATARTPAAGWGAVAAGSTSVSRLAARFVARNGVLTADGVEAATGDNRIVTASGTIDVDRSALDLVLSIAPAPGAASPAGKTLGAFRIEGSWDAPAITRTGSGRAAGAATPVGRDPG